MLGHRIFGSKTVKARVYPYPHHLGLPPLPLTTVHLFKCVTGKMVTKGVDVGVHTQTDVDVQTDDDVQTDKQTDAQTNADV